MSTACDEDKDHAVDDNDSLDMTHVVTTSGATFVRLSQTFQPKKLGSSEMDETK